MTVLVEEEVLKENRSFQTIDCISVVLHIMPVEWLKECVCVFNHLIKFFDAILSYSPSLL